MKRIYTLLFLGFLSLTLLLSCKKKLFNAPDELPPITQEGKNKFGCLVNGELFIPKGGTIGISSQVIKNGDDYILFVKRNNQFLTVRFTALKTGAVPYCLQYDDTDKSCLYEVCINDNSGLNITKLDLQNKIISGRFTSAFTGTNTCSNISITEGRFDYKFD